MKRVNKQAKPLTPKEKNVLEFLESFISKKGYSPTFTEIKEHFGFASINSVQRYLKQLQQKNYIHSPGGNQKRAIELIQSSKSFQKSVLTQTLSQKRPFFEKKAPSSAEPFSIPLLGSVAAGLPIEAMEHDTYVDISPSLVKDPSKTFALTVRGDSMIEAGVLEGDTLFVHQQPVAQVGDMVVAVVDNEATVKYYYPNLEKALIELRPANSAMSSFFYDPEVVEIKGKVIGLTRKI